MGLWASCNRGPQWTYLGWISPGWYFPGYLYILVLGHLIDLDKWSSSWSNLNSNGGSRVGFRVAVLAVGWRRCLHWGCWCVLGSVCVSQYLIDNWCMPVVIGSLMGGDWFWCPCHFWCWWCGLSAVGPDALELTWNVISVVVFGLVLMLDCP